MSTFLKVIEIKLLFFFDIVIRMFKVYGTAGSKLFRVEFGNVISIGFAKRRKDSELFLPIVIEMI